MPREACEATIESFGRGVMPSLDGFARAYAAVAGGVEPAQSPRARAENVGHDASLPSPVQAMFALGRSRLIDYQDARYADLYRERVLRVLAAERASDATGAQGFAATRETARYLASWMAFDDVVRVADLKSRASRMARVRSEVSAEPDDVLRIYDHFKPGIPELAGLLPPSLADRLVRWDRRRVAQGREPWGWPIKLPVHAISGLAMLRLIGGLKRARRHGSRFSTEQAMIERWLAAVERGLREDWQLGHEIVLCGRLVKGYGATNERGKASLLHVIDHLAAAPSLRVDARTTAIRAAREAALADDAGKALDVALQRHGAPPRPVKAQPIRFVRPQASRKVA
jgi:indolepyruvate ferredoxin oxidoreductase beta subunit